MITNFFIPELNNDDVQELWFQQDGATCHTARATIDLLKDAFGDRLISRFGPVNWPPRSSELKPLDYFLWGYVKSLVYADKPQTLDHLEGNIRRVIYGHKCWKKSSKIGRPDWTTSEPAVAISQTFYREFGFPSIYGALDCSLIKILSLGGSLEETFRCRKGFFALNVQTVSDPNLSIRNIVVRCPGSTHDSTVFDHSYLRAHVETEVPSSYHLLGDSGYPMRSYLISFLKVTEHLRRKYFELT
ncbi:nuclease HARBI1 [Trichonephila clavipes]|nr:nuclease HARBI1 [Trichonephila clavipes]